MDIGRRGRNRNLRALISPNLSPAATHLLHMSALSVHSAAADTFLTAHHHTRQARHNRRGCGEQEKNRDDAGKPAHDYTQYTSADLGTCTHFRGPCGVPSRSPKIAGRPAGLLQTKGRLKNRQRKNHSHHTNHHNLSTFLQQKTPRFPRFKPQESSKQTEANPKETRNLPQLTTNPGKHRKLVFSTGKWSVLPIDFSRPEKTYSSAEGATHTNPGRSPGFGYRTIRGLKDDAEKVGAWSFGLAWGFSPTKDL
jgi:hypothetical protein